MTNLTVDEDEEIVPLAGAPPRSKENTTSTIGTPSLCDELWASTDLIFQSRFTVLLILGPIAVVGNATDLLGPAACFTFSGISLIPLAERLSFVTEQVAYHTNGTIGALLNATFGNAPELLISVAALRSGYYRVVQLTMLGSMFTNMIFVFGVACLVGGLRWQVQELRTTSGNVNVVMLLLATAGSLFPSALIMTGQLPGRVDGFEAPSEQEVTFSRVNAAVMLSLYLCFLVFQLGTHKEEFDGELRTTSRARKNLLCRRYIWGARRLVLRNASSASEYLEETSGNRIKFRSSVLRELVAVDESSTSAGAHEDEDEDEDFVMNGDSDHSILRRTGLAGKSDSLSSMSARPSSRTQHKLKTSIDLDSDDEMSEPPHAHPGHEGPQISLRLGITWLFIITLGVSAITDVLVDTIDGFAVRMKISEVFTSMVIIPFFSNVAEQVSAFIFAYRNEMDLCVGVTVGSAIQVATFVLPGSVLIGMVMDRPMTLFFRGYETVSLFFGVVVVGAILQGGSTNWLVGVILVGVYIIFAAGVWFHEIENLTVDADELFANVTRHS
jgi:Ca2+/H+ antiporter